MNKEALVQPLFRLCTKACRWCTTWVFGTVAAFVIEGDMTTWTVEFAYERFKQNRSLIAAAEDTNEATTRLRAIDTFIFDVLGWDKLTVDAEHYCRATGFADYALKDRATVCLLIEAKRADETFVLPHHKFSPAPIGFPLLAKECPAAGLA